jgi:hypothetical protein
MAVAIPLLSIAGGVSTGMAVAAGTMAMSWGAALSIMGGMVSGLGLLSGDKKFQRIGGILSAASGIVGGLQKAAAETASGAAAGETAATLTAEGAAGSESLLTGGATGAQEMPSLARQFANQAPAPTAMTGMETGTSAMTGIDSAGNVVAPMGGGMGSAGAAPSSGIAQQLTGTGYGALPQGTDALLTGGTNTAGTPSLLQQAASGMTQADLAGATKQAQMLSPSGLWNTAKTGFNDFTGWVQKNPQAAALLMQGISGTAQSYEQDKQNDYQRSLYERARANLNSPVRLTFTPGG